MKHPKWALFVRQEIPSRDGLGLYLTRWRILQTPFLSVYLHKFHGPDANEPLHDHPWNFLSIVLRGGYIEREKIEQPPLSLVVSNVRRTGSIAFRKADTFHRVHELLRTPTWTLVFCGRRRKSWGFATHKDFVHWREYLGVD